jgi:23S rRNA pseudouridine1911/1915/1917 synthase
VTLVPAALDGERVDRAVSTLFGLPRSQAASIVSAGGVRLAGRPVSARSRRVAEGELLEVDVPPSAGAAPLAGDPEVDVPVVHADEAVVVVDKPAGLVVHPGAGRPRGTLVQGLLARFPEIAGVGDPRRPGIVQRLDVGTSGLMVVARTPAAYQSLVAQLAARTVERRYLALVWGCFEAPSGAVDAPVGRSAGNRTSMAVSARGRPARTRYRVIAQYRDPVDAAVVECALETGRTHQVRVHMAAVGHPVVGDARYGGARAPLGARRPLLHASQLGFDHPATGERCRFSSPPPADLEDVRGLLR